MSRYRRSGSGISPLGPLVKRMLENLGLQSKVRERQAMAEWADVVGEQISAVAIPADIRDGILYVSCRSSAWSNELTFLKPEITARLNERIGAEVIKDIRFSARGFKKQAAAETGVRAPTVRITKEDREKADAIAQQSGTEELHEKIRNAVLAGRQRAEQERREQKKRK